MRKGLFELDMRPAQRFMVVEGSDVDLGLEDVREPVCRRQRVVVRAFRAQSIGSTAGGHDVIPLDRLRKKVARDDVAAVLEDVEVHPGMPSRS